MFFLHSHRQWRHILKSYHLLKYFYFCRISKKMVKKNQFTWMIFYFSEPYFVFFFLETNWEKNHTNKTFCVQTTLTLFVCSPCRFVVNFDAYLAVNFKLTLYAELKLVTATVMKEIHWFRTKIHMIHRIIMIHRAHLQPEICWLTQN